MDDAEERVARACSIRAARAELLAGKYEAAAEPLRFAAGLYRAQGSVRLSADFASAVAAALPIIEFVARAGPPALAADARDFPRERLSAYWGGLSEFDYLSRAALMPYARFLRESGIPLGRPEGPCKVCGGAPWMATRRSASSADGAMRMLSCALCGFEWQTSRISHVAMYYTCNSVLHMGKMIQIRNVPEALREVRKTAERPTIEELLERIRSRSPVRLREAPADAVRAERDNR